MKALMAGLTGHGHNHSVRASATSGQWVPDAPTNISDRPLRGASEEWGSTLPAPSRLLDRSPSSRSIRPSIRLPDRRGALRCAGGGGCGECWARGRPRGVSGGGYSPVVCDPRSCAHLKSSNGYRIQQVHYASRVPRTPASRPLRAIRPADRGPAVRCGGGEGVRGGRWAGAC